MVLSAATFAPKTLQTGVDNPTARRKQRTYREPEVTSIRPCEQRAKTATDHSRNGSSGSAAMAQPLAAADNQRHGNAIGARHERYRQTRHILLWFFRLLCG